MNWTTEKPTRPGFYWVKLGRAIDLQYEVIVEVKGDPLRVYHAGNDGDYPIDDLDYIMWQGPLTP